MRNIYLKLQGGLGNQLFQWVYAHYLLSKNDNSEFFYYCLKDQQSSENQLKSRSILNVAWLCSHSSRADWAMNKFIAECEYPDKLWERRKLRPIIENLMGLYREDPRFNVDQTWSPNLARVKILSGYFQSSRFLSNVINPIWEEIHPIIDNTFVKLEPRIQLPKSYTCVHVRSGDYFNANLDNPHVIGRLSSEFYRQLRRTSDENPLVLVAPEIENIREIVEILKPDLILTGYNTTDWETLSIMANAQIFYGANSSLSWWGAWLGSLQGNDVCLPSSWSKNAIVDDSDYEFDGLRRAPAFWE